MCFAAIMGFTAGAATALNPEYLEAAFNSMGEVQGSVLLSLALLSMLWNTALYSFCRIFSGKGGGHCFCTGRQCAYGNCRAGRGCGLRRGFHFSVLRVLGSGKRRLDA